MKYKCAFCSYELKLKSEQQENFCEGCGGKYHFSDNYLQYDFDPVLLRKFGSQYLLNKALNNNGYLSYLLLPEGSISLPDRQEVINFRDYIYSNFSAGRLLDIGCGVLPIPGYLNFPDKTKFEFFGMDPIADRSFFGTRIVGCSEYTPFYSDSFDALIFATSLDHVCSLKETMKESLRILKPGGRVLIWMGDRSQTLKQRFMSIAIDLRNRLCLAGIINPDPIENAKEVYKVGRYFVYPGKAVLYVPKGAVDPFHSYFETPSQIMRLMKKVGFNLIDMTYLDKNQVFLCFSKKA